MLASLFALLLSAEPPPDNEGCAPPEVAPDCQPPSCCDIELSGITEIPEYAPAPEDWPEVRVAVSDTRTGEDTIPQVVHDACDILQINCVEGFGGIRLILLEEPIGGTLGTAYFWPTMPCARIAWATADKQVIAHEMGHLLGLDHVPIEGNLMYPSREGGGSKLEPVQHWIMDAEAEWLNVCYPA